MKKSYISEHFRRVVYTILLMAGMMLWGSHSLKAQGLPITGTDAVRCGAGDLTLTVGWSGTALDASKVKWYTVPFYGTPIATGLTYSTGYIEFTRTFYVDYVGDNGCSQCNRLLVRAVINDQVINPQISYSSLKFCNNLNQTFTPTIVGASSGTFTVSPSTGLTVDGSTGSFNPNGASPGQYTITFTPVQVVGCNSGAVSTSVNITQALVSPDIEYASTSYCTEGAAPTPTLTGATGGSFSAVPAGLSINTSTGKIDLSSSAAGSYTITYLVPGQGGCSPVSDNFNLAVVKYPTVSLAYQTSPFTKNQTSATVTLTGSGDYTGGTFSYSGSASNALSINTSTGEINPSASDAGVYTVTYTKTVTGTCSGTISAQTTVTVYPLPTAAIAGTTTVCEEGTPPAVIFTGANGTSPYTFTYTINNGTELNVSSAQGVSTAQLNQSTAVAGTYTYVLTKVMDATGSYQSVTGQSAVVTITPASVATFMYLGGSFCQSGTVEPTFTGGGTAGVFTASSANLKFVDEAGGASPTGKVDLAASTPGTYTVTNIISSCGSVSETAQITVYSPPTVAIAGSQTVTYGDLTTYSGTDDATYLYNWSVTGNATIPGDKTGKTVDVSATGAGTYTLTLSVTNANGCQNSAKYTVTVNKAELTVTAMDQGKIYDGSVFSSANYLSVYSGFKFDDSESVVSGSIAYSGTAITAVNSGSYVITPEVSSLVADNYTFKAVNGTLTINKAFLTVTADDKTVTYGDATPTLTYSLTGFVNGENVTSAGVTGAPTLSTTYTNTTGVASSPVTITVVNIGTLTATNYDFQTLVNGKITINKAALTVTADDKTVTYGGAIPALTYTMTGFVNSEVQANVTTGSPALSTSYTSTTLVTSSPVAINAAVGTLASANYSFAFVGGKITIEKATSTIAATGTTTYTYSGFAQGPSTSTVTGSTGAVTYSYSGTGSTTYSASSTAPIAAGTYQVVATVAADVNYNSAISEAYPFTINKVALIVTAEDKTVTYGSAMPTLTYTMTGFVNGEVQANVTTGSPSLSTSYTSTTSVTSSPVAINAAVGTLESANYSFAFVDGKITINKAALTVTADKQVKGLGQSDPTLTVTYSGFVNNESVVNLGGTLSVERAIGETAGTYTITPSGLTSNNYTITFTTGTLTIANVVLTAKGGTLKAGYSNLSQAFTKINDGTHQGTITVTIFTNLTEDDPAVALLDSNGTKPNYTSVTIVADSKVTVTGTVTLGN